MMVAVIVYGSLYPFEFFRPQDSMGSLRGLLSTWRTWTGRGDIISNIMLYVPFGVFAVCAINKIIRAPFRIAGAVLAGTSLSFAMELAQYFVAGRFSSLADVYCAAAGSLLGALAGCALSGKTQLVWLEDLSARPFVAILLVCWLGYRLYPFEPVIDLHKYWDALKPLILFPQISALSVFRHMIAWLVISQLLDTALGRVRGRMAVVLLFCTVLFARVLIDGLSLTASEVCGGVLGVSIWLAALSRYRGRTVLIAAMFATSVILQGLEPFQFSSAARPFGWIPFRSLLQSPINTAIVSFFEKVFNYGCLVWLLAQAGLSSRTAVALGGALVLGLRMTQVYLPGRSAEITDFIMLLIIAGIMHLLGTGAKFGDELS
jgi:VanZ family protein